MQRYRQQMNSQRVLGVLCFLLACLGLVGLFTSGCSPSTFRSALEYTHKGVNIATTLQQDVLQQKCLEAAAKCKGTVKTVEQCTPYIRCRDIQRKVKAGINMIQQGIQTAETARREAVAAGLWGDK